MSIHLRHYGIIKNGKKTYYNQPLYNQQLLNLEGQEFEEVIKKRFHKVSNDQHNYYRGAVLATAHKHDAFIHFNKADDIHNDVIAPMFLSHIKTVTLKGRTFDKIEYTSTASFSKQEMSEFIERVISWLVSEFDIIIYSPESYYLSLNQK